MLFSLVVCAGLLADVPGDPPKLRLVDGTQVSVREGKAGDLIPVFEAVLQRRVIVDSRAAEVKVDLVTSIPLRVGEVESFVKLCLGAAGLTVVEAGPALVVCRRENFRDGWGASALVRRKVVLKFLDVSDAVAVVGRWSVGSNGERSGLEVRNGPSQSSASTQIVQPVSGVAGLASAGSGASISQGGGVGMSGVAPQSVALSQFDGLASAQDPKLLCVRYDGLFVVGDPVNHVLVLEGSEAVVAEVLRLLQDLDVEPDQVVMRCVIGEYSITGNRTFGVDWSWSLTAGGPQQVAAVLNNSGVALPSVAGVLSSASPGLSLYGLVEPGLGAFVSALEETSKFRVLQRPVIATLNGKAARIFSGQQVAIAAQSLTQASTVSGAAAISSTTQYVPVRLQVDVVPRIYAGGLVRLELQESYNNVSGYTTIAGNQVPNITEQGVKTTLVVRSGGSVLLGGLVTESTTSDKTGLPFLNNVPVVGRLFGHDTEGKNRQEILVFIQPEVLRGAPIPRAEVVR